jgi:signal transduction histidine kinase/DNA-binding response OmpR family regulator
MLCFFVLYFWQLSAENGGSGSFTLTEPLKWRLEMYDSTKLLPEEGGMYTIEEILRGECPEFVDSEFVSSAHDPFFYWMRLELKNATERTIAGALRLPSFADSIWVYSVVDNSVVDIQLSGRELGLRDKHLRGHQSSVPLSIDPRNSKTIYCRVRYSGSAKSSHQSFAYLALYSEKMLEKAAFDLYFEHGAFAGMLLLLSLVSIFLYVVFRELVFVYFAGLVLCLAWYFLTIRFVLGGQLNLTSTTLLGSTSYATGGITLFLSLFVTDYLRFAHFFPKVHRWYLTVSLATAASFILLQFIIERDIATGFNNYLLAGWVIGTSILIVIRALNKDKPARVMLLSITPLAIGAGAFLLKLLQGWTVDITPLSGFQIGTVIFASILFYSLFDKYNVLRAERLKVEKVNELKNRFFANISHEFRTPLTLMMGPIQQVMEKLDDPQDKMLLEIAHRNANHQLNLVNQLLDLAKAESGELKLRTITQDFIPLLKGTVYSFASLAEQRGLQLEVNSPKEPLLLAVDVEKMEQVIINLISNACKFTPEGGQITVGLTAKPSEVLMTVTDTGRGISSERLPHVFDRFFRDTTEETETMEGHGIGLALVKELVELHYGTITIDSEPGKGTSVSVVLPRGTSHLQPGELLSQPIAKNKTHESKTRLASDKLVTVQAKDTGSEEATHILLIEDNADVRTFIRQRLDPSYHITEAADGEAGIQKALAEMPDLIISDVMMPKKDGYEVCQALKTDVRTCHIPVILLTAKAGREEKLEGLETGADDYLTKPFDAQELELRVANLIRLREQLRQRFATAISIRPSEIVTNSLDQTFLENALAVVEANIGNEDFNIDAFALEVGMSRPNLNRKLRALVNQSSNQFIQSIRLQRAADMLRRKTGNVGEIAFQTGFRSTAYFVKCFGAHFGVTPGNFAENPPEANENNR